jgi:hypothetical protein
MMKAGFFVFPQSGLLDIDDLRLGSTMAGTGWFSSSSWRRCNRCHESGVRLAELGTGIGHLFPDRRPRP